MISLRYQRAPSLRNLRLIGSSTLPTNSTRLAPSSVASSAYYDSFFDAGALTALLSQNCLPIPGKAIDVDQLDSPSAFHQTLINLVRSAETNITIATLYIGDGSKQSERQLVRELRFASSSCVHAARRVARNTVFKTSTEVDIDLRSQSNSSLFCCGKIASRCCVTVA